MKFHCSYSTVSFITLLVCVGCSSDTNNTNTGITGGSGGTVNTGGTGNNGATSGEAGAGNYTSEGTLTISVANPITTSSLAFGINYWSWVAAWGNPVAGSETLIEALHPTWLRLGGHNNDTNTPEPTTHAVLDTFVAYAQAVGAEPLIQVPVLASTEGNEPTAQEAADWVTYLNVTQQYGIKYFAIGNEPDLYPDQGDKPSNYTVSDFCTTFHSFATAMKAVDPSIKIVGPDLSWKYQSGSNDWFTPFLTECGSDVDIVSVHRYPFAPEASTIANAKKDRSAFKTLITSLHDKMTTAGVGDKPLAITEANITYDGDPTKATTDAAAGSFPAALWAIDNFASSLELGLFSYDYWSISEGYYLGLLVDDSAHELRPVYKALKLLREHFGTQLVSITGQPSGISSYASRTASNDETTIVIVNWNTEDTALTLKVTGTSTVITDVVTPIPALSLSLVRIPDQGTAAIYQYVDPEGTNQTSPVQLQ